MANPSPSDIEAISSKVFLTLIGKYVTKAAPAPGLDSILLLVGRAVDRSEGWH